MSRFCHTHVHTEYSPLDGSIRIPEYVKRCKELGMDAAAITDHGNLHGVLKFYKACVAEKIKPLVGIEAYCTTDPDGVENKEKNRDNDHLVLIAKNNQGYQDLLRLISRANTHNFYYKPRIWYESLKDCGSNLIASTACLGGRVPKALEFSEDETRIVGGEDRAEEAIDFLYDIFKENLYLEFQETPQERQVPYNHWLVHQARRKSIPLIVTTDAHFLRREDFKLHELMMAMQFRKTLEKYRAENKMVYGPDYYIKDFDEMMEVAQRYGAPEAVENTAKIADSCDVTIELGGVHFPTFDITETEDFEEFQQWKKARIKETL